MSWPLGKKHSPESIERMSAASKKALADPAVRERMSAAHKKAWADKFQARGITPEIRELYALARRKGFNKTEAVSFAIREARA